MHGNYPGGSQGVLNFGGPFVQGSISEVSQPKVCGVV